MKKKIDPLFALSVLVLVLGVFALACSWVPFQGQCSESDNVAWAETFSVGSVSNTDFVIGTTSEAKVWPSSSALVGYMVKGLPKVSDFSALASSSPVRYVVKVHISGLVNGSNYGATTSLEFSNRLQGQEVSAFTVGMSAQDYFDLNIYTDYVFTGDLEAYSQFCNKSFASRFFAFSDDGPLTVSYTFQEGDVEFTLDTMSDKYRQFLSIVNDCVAFSPVDFASYGDYLLNNQVDPELQQKYVDLQKKYQDLQKKYQDLLYDYSLVAPAGTSVVQWGTVFKFSPVFGETSLPADNSVSYEGPYMLGNVSSIKGTVGFYDVAATLSTDKHSWYPSSISVGKYVCFGLPFGATFSPNDTITYKFSSPVFTQMMVGVYDSERKIVYFKSFLNNVSNVSFSAFDYRVSNDNDRIVFYGFVKDSSFSVGDFLVPTDVDTLYVTTSEGQESYNSGFNAGVNSVKSQYESQLEAVKENARQKGFAEAEAMFNNGNADYSFFGLISAVIDAPIKAIRGLLNFDILGVNMFAFVTSLFSLAVVLMIVKLLLGTRDVV